MKIIINIPDLTYESIMKSKVLKDVGADFIRNGKPLPDNATNGDVIKALFSKDIADVIKNRMISDWWNEPYKEVENDKRRSN